MYVRFMDFCILSSLWLDKIVRIFQYRENVIENVVKTDVNVLISSLHIPTFIDMYDNL